MTGQFAAHASMLGYLYQIRYALLLLVKAGFEDQNKSVALETLDDISFEEKGTPLELIQTKHRAEKADLTDSSSDLWKSLRVWCAFYTEHPTSQATLTLVTTATATPGSVVELLRLNGSHDVSTVHQRLVAIAQHGGNVALKSAYDAFLALPEDARLNILSRVQVIDDSKRISDLPGEIKRLLCYTG